MKHLTQFIIVLFICTLNAQVSDFKAIDFTKADNIAKSNKGRSLKNMPLLAYKLTSNLDTDAEKFRAIYTWVCTNIKGDFKQSEKVRRKRKKFKNDSLAYINWNTKYKKEAFKKLLNNKKTMCTGYAYLIKELCFLANIEAKIIDGYGRTTTTNIANLEIANHSWNAVKLNNKWYLCDATWSSGYTLPNGYFVSDYNDGYFLTEPLLFAQNHYPLHKKWLLNTTLINQSFKASPLVYGETFKHKIVLVSPQKMNVVSVKNKTLNFSFKTLEYNTKTKVALINFSGENIKNYTITNLKNDNGLITFQSKFNHKGFYDVHLKIDNDIVATYTIKVTKS